MQITGLNFPSFSPCKDVSDQALLKTSTARIAWMLFTQKLTLAGRWMALPSIVFASSGAVSMVYQGYVIFSYAFAIWAVSCVGMLFFRPKVRVKAHFAPRVCAGETMPVDVEVEQLARLAQIELFALPHKLPATVDAEPDQGVALPTLRRGQKTRVRLGLKCNKRGVHQLNGFRIESGFPFGLLRAARVFKEATALIVYPRFHPLTRMDLPVGRRHHPGGVLLASQLGESMEFIGDRDYREGDSIRDIDWRATARLNRPIVREYREEYFMRVAVILDTHVPKGAPEVLHEGFERSVSVAASVADYMARQDYLVDLFAAGTKLYHLTAGRSLAYLDQILDILAAVDENVDEPFDTVEPELFSSLAQITTVICIMLDWTDSRRQFVHKLVSMGCGVRVIIVREGKCSVAPGEDSAVMGSAPVITKAIYEAGFGQL